MKQNKLFTPEYNSSAYHSTARMSDISSSVDDIDLVYFFELFYKEQKEDLSREYNRITENISVITSDP